MTRRRTVLAVSVLGLLVTTLLTSCGDDGGGPTGTVAVLLADGPADDYDHLFVTIREVSLISTDNEFSPEVLFRSEAGLEVDLLDLRDEDFLVAVKRSVAAGTYSKIRLEVSDVRPEGGPCEQLRTTLPSGRMDLNPRRDFEVVAGGTLSIRFDIDANKSLNLHVAGYSGRCVFRPVVYSDDFASNGIKS